MEAVQYDWFTTFEIACNGLDINSAPPLTEVAENLVALPAKAQPAISEAEWMRRLPVVSTEMQQLRESKGRLVKFDTNAKVGGSPKAARKVIMADAAWWVIGLEPVERPKKQRILEPCCGSEARMSEYDRVRRACWSREPTSKVHLARMKMMEYARKAHNKILGSHGGKWLS